MESMIFVEPQLGGIGSHFIPKNHPKICFLTMLKEHKSQELNLSYNFPPLCILPKLE